MDRRRRDKWLSHLSTLPLKRCLPALKQVEGAIAAGHQAWRSWSRTPVGERGRLMHRVASYLRENKPRIARLITLEMGKPIVESEAEIEKCALTCDFYADNAERFLSAEPVKTNAAQSYVAYSCWRSCPGTSLSGRSFASPPPPLWRATRRCSNTPPTCRSARSLSKRPSVWGACRKVHFVVY